MSTDTKSTISIETAEATTKPHPRAIDRAEDVIPFLIDEYSFERIKIRRAGFPESMTYEEYRDIIFDRLAHDSCLAASIQTVMYCNKCKLVDLESCVEMPIAMFYIKLKSNTIVYCCTQ